MAGGSGRYSVGEFDATAAAAQLLYRGRYRATLVRSINSLARQLSRNRRMTEVNGSPATGAEQGIGLANRLERLMERLTPLNALVITLTSGFLLLLVAFVLELGWNVYDPAIHKGHGKEVGFIVAPNWFIVYLILFPPYVFLFGQVVSFTNAFLGWASQAQKGLITNEEGLVLLRGEVLTRWRAHLRPLSVSLYVLLIGTTISSVLQWIYECFQVYSRSELLTNKGNYAVILGGKVIDWSTRAYAVPTSTEVAKLATLWFSAGAYAYMAIALFIYLAVLAYYAFVCWFVMRLASDTAETATRLIIRGNQPFKYFSELFCYICAAVVLGLSAGYCMRLQAEYLNSAEISVFSYAFTDLRCVAAFIKDHSLSNCWPMAWSATESRGTASSFTGIAEAVYTLALFTACIVLLWRAFNFTKAHYLERIGDPQWQRTVGIKYDSSFVEKIERSTFLSTIVPNYKHLLAAIALLITVIAIPFLGAVYLTTVIYAFVTLMRNDRHRVDLKPTNNSIYTTSFRGTALQVQDREEIVLFLGFQQSSYDFGPFLEYVVEEADIPKNYRNYIKAQISRDGVNNPAEKLVEITLNYEPLDGEKSTVLGNILVAICKKVGLDFGCFVAVKSKSARLILDTAVLEELRVSCVKWDEAKTG
jgi:hypothetical protein